MKAVSVDRPQAAAIVRVEGWGRFVRAFALDLAVSVILVLVAARIFGAVSGFVPQDAWTANVQAAVSRFSPFGLWDVYGGQVRSAIADTVGQADAGAFGNMLLGFRLLYDVLAAAPDTLWSIWQQTETASDWITLIGFGGILLGTFSALVTSGRLTLLRLVLSAVGSPIAAIGLFWIAQQTVLDALSGFVCYVAVAPWCLLCPVLCTAFWVAFPAAEHGATVSILQACGRLRLSRVQPRGTFDVPRGRK